jgi:Signal peptidase, peptidase S26
MLGREAHKRNCSSSAGWSQKTQLRTSCERTCPASSSIRSSTVTSAARRGYVYINGRRLAEPYINPALRGTGSGAWPRVGPKDYFFLGDNRTHSCDSRNWGTVPRKNLIGPVLFTYWPTTRLSLHSIAACASVRECPLALS